MKILFCISCESSEVTVIVLPALPEPDLELPLPVFDSCSSSSLLLPLSLLSSDPDWSLEDESIEDYLEAYGVDLDVIDVMPIRGIIMDVNLSDTVPFQVIRGGGDDDKGRFA